MQTFVIDTCYTWWYDYYRKSK